MKINIKTFKNKKEDLRIEQYQKEEAQKNFNDFWKRNSETE